MDAEEVLQERLRRKIRAHDVRRGGAKRRRSVSETAADGSTRGWEAREFFENDEDGLGQLLAPLRDDRVGARVGHVVGREERRSGARGVAEDEPSEDDSVSVESAWSATDGSDEAERRSGGSMSGALRAQHPTTPPARSVAHAKLSASASQRTAGDARAQRHHDAPTGTSVDALEVVMAGLRGPLNRLTDTNIASVAPQVLEALRAAQNRGVEAAALAVAVTRTISTACVGPGLFEPRAEADATAGAAAMLNPYTGAYAALLTFLHVTLSPQVGAAIVRACRDALSASAVPYAPDVVLATYALLGNLYLTGLVDASLPFGLVRERLDARADVAQTLGVIRLLQICGPQLLHDDARRFQAMAATVEGVVAALKLEAPKAMPDERDLKRRLVLEVLQDVVCELQHRQSINGCAIDNRAVLRAARWLAEQVGAARLAVHRIGVHDGGTGAADACGDTAWAKREDFSAMPLAEGSAPDPTRGRCRETPSTEAPLEESASLPRFHDAAARDILTIISTAADSLETARCIQKRVPRHDKHKRDRVVIRVIVHRCLRERVFRTLYVDLLQHLLSYYGVGWVVTLQFTMWDTFRSLLQELSDRGAWREPLRQWMHLARLLGALLQRRVLDKRVMRGLLQHAHGGNAGDTALPTAAQLFFHELRRACGDASDIRSSLPSETKAPYP